MKILVGYNGSSISKTALKLAMDFAKVFNARIHIMFSQEGGANEKLKDIKHAKRELQSAKESVEQKGLQCETVHMARGLSPGEDIVLYATENDIAHIFVGIKKKSRTQKLLLGSTAQYVILKAGCPVTTVK